VISCPGDVIPTSNASMFPKRLLNLSAGRTRKLGRKHRLIPTASYYKIRSNLLATTQTLKQKEHDVRHLLVTGRRPQFMKSTTLSITFKEHSDEWKKVVLKDVIAPKK